jgi:hypothetical protein
MSVLTLRGQPNKGEEMVLAAIATPTVTPTQGTSLPIFGTLQGFLDSVGWLALLLCVAAIIIGGIRWALGSSSSNPAQAGGGKNMVIGGAIGAAIIGAANLLVNIAFNAGVTLN